MNIIPIKPIPARVAIIGGGIFGTLSALKLAENGCKVILYEAGMELLNGASIANQNRLHLGYHYPRSEQTAWGCMVFEKGFRREYYESVIDFEHYYAFANSGNVGMDEFENICKRIPNGFNNHLSIDGIKFNKNLIEGFIKVNEGIIDIGILRRQILSMESALILLSMLLMGILTG
jgi:L-2-hydroxyglutarate oxidase LhgO